MAARLGLQRCARLNIPPLPGITRWIPFISQPPLLPGFMDSGIPSSTELILPEFDRNPNEKISCGSISNYNDSNGCVALNLPSLFSEESMELMAVPKKKVSKHKRGIRNGPKALKPTPVIVRCRVCGRVKLPHFYCCSGHRSDNGEQHNSNS